MIVTPRASDRTTLLTPSALPDSQLGVLAALTQLQAELGDARARGRHPSVVNKIGLRP
jgi:hypothetical protein